MLLFPIGTERKLRSRPWLTIGLIAANVFVFFFLQPHPPASNFSLVWARFAWWMPATYMFSHGDIFHLLGNMLILWVFGPHAEDALGRGRVLVVYFSAGLGAAALHVLASVAFYPQEATMGLVGASGAIMGIVALFVLRFHGVRVRFFFWLLLPAVFHVRALWVGIAYLVSDLGWALLGVGAGGGGGVAHWAHVGGFLVGGIWAWRLRLAEEGTHEIRFAQAQGYVRAGAWDRAARVLEGEIAARPGDPELHSAAALCYEHLQGAEHRAAAHWNEHLRLLLVARREDEALARFRALITRFRPRQLDPAVLLRLGAAAERQSAHDLAVAAWMGVAQAHPDRPQAPAAALRAAQALLRMGESARARTALQVIESTWPDSEEALSAAQMLREMG
ncbi:MAG: rhomboid family intramembrane serine protease [Armatimonadota bacterium]